MPALDFLLDYGLFLLVGFPAFAWLVVVAFRESPAWGLTVLLLPPLGAAVFAVVHWRAARIPFLVFICTLSVQVALLLGAFDNRTSESFGILASYERGQLNEDQAIVKLTAVLTDQAVQQKGLSEADLNQLRREIELHQREPDPYNESANRMFEEIVAGIPASYMPPAPPIPAAPEADQAIADTPPAAGAAPALVTGKTFRIEPRAAPEHMGDYMLIINRKGLRREGTLVQVQADGLRFRRGVLGAGGYLEFEMKYQDIARLELRRH